MNKRKIISIMLIFSIMVSVFAISAVSVSAAYSPTTPTATIVNGGSANGLYVKWDNTGYYYEVAYRPKGVNVSGMGYTREYTYNNYLTLTEVTSGICYEVQVRAYDNETWSGWSKTRSMTFIARPSLGGKYKDSKNYIYWKDIPGANKYVVVRFDVDKKTYKTVYSGSKTSFIDEYIPLGKHKYQIRAMLETLTNGTAYSSWSKVTTMNWNLSPSDAQTLICDYFQSKGLNRAAACGIVANMQTICRLEVDNYTKEMNIFGSKAGGLCAWYSDNYERLERDCPEWKVSLSEQLDYLWKTLLKNGIGKETDKYYYPNCTGCLNRLLFISNTADGASEAAKIFCTNYVFVSDLNYIYDNVCQNAINSFQ